VGRWSSSKPRCAPEDVGVEPLLSVLVLEGLLPVVSRNWIVRIAGHSRDLAVGRTDFTDVIAGA